MYLSVIETCLSISLCMLKGHYRGFQRKFHGCFDKLQNLLTEHVNLQATAQEGFVNTTQ